MKTNDFYAALYEANLLYGITLSDDKFEEIGLIGWNKIGNKSTRLYHYFTTPINGEVALPCNCDIIEAVCYTFESIEHNKLESGFNNDSGNTEHFIEAQKILKNPLYISGDYVKYREIGDYIYVDEDIPLHILYHGVQLDNRDLPYLNDREVSAIAAYVAFVLARKEYYINMNREILQKAMHLEAEWKKLCNLARVPDHLNQNDMNNILEAKYNWNRKIFNKSYKPLK